MNNSRLGLPTILFVVFLVLKLLGTISWSWWWVTSPLWISFGVWLLLAVLAFVLAVLFAGSVSKTHDSFWDRW